MTKNNLTYIENLTRTAKGGYVLEFKIDKQIFISVGKLGEISLSKGFYYYIGSAMNGLRSRLLRHIRDDKKIHWHVDYLTAVIKPSKIWFVVSEIRIESEINAIVSCLTVPAVDGFGCGDSPEDVTHLHFSASPLNLKKTLSRINSSITEIDF